ncbi:MAG: right-handed parallel beta-helix repeat-containing protein [Planctomycetota bacterium]
MIVACTGFACIAATAIAETKHVDTANCPGPGTGLDIDPFCKIQDCIDMAIDGDECVVAPGTYQELINFSGKAIVVRSASGASTTTIDAAGLNDSVVKCVNAEGPHSVLEGFTITGGNAKSGGGMLVQASGPTVNRCTFVGNTAGAGGGLFAVAGNSSPKINECQFIGNTAEQGGGLFFSHNISSGDATEVTNCLIAANTASVAGGGVVSFNYNDLFITNCTFTTNASQQTPGGAMYSFKNQVSFEVSNCIFWGDSPDEIWNSLGGTFTYNVVQGGFPGKGNIDSNPWFVDPDGSDGDPNTVHDNDLRLAQGSPCTDAGDSNALHVGAVTDLAGNPRRVDDPATDDTGVGEPPVVDMGAYEYTCGNGNVDSGEDCDSGVDGPNDCCSSSCAFVKQGSLCGAGPKACSSQDTCDGNGGCSANDLPVGTPCGLPGDMEKCISGEYCSGGGVCLPSIIVTACVDDDQCCNRGAGCNATNDSDCDKLIPTVSSWGLLLLALLLGVCAKVMFRPGQSPPTR